MEQLGITSFHNRITVAQITEILEKSADILCELMASTHTSSKAATLDEVLKYIQENQFDINFSLQAIADHFGMSVSNFSHYFKKNAGQNFKDFMDGRRINHSKQLLIHSDETIDWIAGRVGYTNPSSFIRAFKKHVGVTPGQFRLFNK
jgi:AraC-like DNA-binding protein